MGRDFWESAWWQCVYMKYVYMIRSLATSYLQVKYTSWPCWILSITDFDTHTSSSLFRAGMQVCGNEADTVFLDTSVKHINMFSHCLVKWNDTLLLAMEFIWIGTFFFKILNFLFRFYEPGWCTTKMWESSGEPFAAIHFAVTPATCRKELVISVNY